MSAASPLSPDSPYGRRARSAAPADASAWIQDAPDEPPAQVPAATRQAAERRLPPSALEDWLEPGQDLRRTFRPEIHGLRAVAILLVAAYHIWFGRVSGGVDVFLFISAFLLTGTFLRRMEAGRPVAVAHYWLRTFKRLLPPAVVVILGSLALSWWLLPATSWSTVHRHAVGSLLYIQNYVLAADSVDYYAHDAAAASPLQHCWSMSVQGQIFLLWPVLFALGALWLRLRRGRSSPRRVMLVIFGIVGAASFAWSIVITAADQGFAYFDTGARLWEFAAGSLLALALPLLDRRRERRGAGRRGIPATLLGWVGLLALIACGALLDVQGLFPGWIALWPLAAAGLVILVGETGRAWGVDRALSWAPISFLGSIAYALYLVHWPLLIGWLAYSDRERAGLLDGLAVFGAAILLAWLLTRLVDTPVRRSPLLDARPRWALAVVAASLTVGLVAAQVAFPALTARTVAGPAEEPTAQATTAEPSHPGAAWSGDPLTAGHGAPIPGPEEIIEPESRMPTDCGGSFAPEDGVVCLAMLPEDEEPEVTVMLAGDSHAAQYTAAAMSVPEEKGWAVYYVGYPACSITTPADEERCTTLHESWDAALDSVQPDVVVTLGSYSSTTGTEETVMPADYGVFPGARERGIPVLLLRDNPRWPKGESRYDCATEAMRSGGDATDADLACGDDIEDKFAAGNPVESLASDNPASPVHVADTAGDVLCPNGRCSPVIGNVFVFRDSDHLTSEFSATMGPWFAEQVDATFSLAEGA